MVLKKEVEGENKPKDLWKEKLVSPIPMNQYARDTEEVEKIILFGESSTGKTRWYLNILNYIKNVLKLPPEKVLLYIIYPDRPTGIVKLYNLIPKEYVENSNPRVHILPINNYEDMVSATAQAEQALMEHYKKTGVHGWLICELLDEAWRMSQDYYSRQAFGETLADYLALQRETVKEKMKKLGKEDKDTAFQALGGWQDWSVIKFFHNFNWVDKIKRMPFNVLFTAEIRAEENKDSIFSVVGFRPSGEKDNMHRVDTILYLKHVGDKFYQRCFKWTGMSRVYSDIEITDKNGYEVHKQIEKNFESKGFKTSAIEELEKEAGIPNPPKKEEPKKEEPKKEEKPKEERSEKVEWTI